MEQLVQDLTTIKVYADDYHLLRQLKKCNECGQLYFYEFYEWLDWEAGNDPQYTTWIPVQNVETADEISQLSPLGLLSFTGIRRNFPAEAKQPSDPKWVVKANQEK